MATNTNLNKLFKLLVKHKFNFNVSAITTAMYFVDEKHAEWDSKAGKFKVDKYPLTNKIEIFDSPRHKIVVYTCTGLDALVDMDNKEFQIMDADEVAVWALGELRDDETLYGEA